ncbi:MAG: type II toxin-antitoxin system VapC family toxin [Vulcanimicrobiaceae bacterium]
MNYLLDTNALLFWLQGSERMGKAVLSELIDPANRVYVSSVSAFEIAVKASLERLSLPESPGTLFPPFFAQSRLSVLPISMEHGFGVYDLPWHHTDPFDRLLISQALCEDLTLVTSDRRLAAYAVKIVLLK